MSEESNGETMPFGNKGQRVVLLVTTPVGESFQSIAKATGFRAPPAIYIDWPSHENSALPNLASRLKFTTHYAVCVIDLEMWERAPASLLEKFKTARFWDHPGDYTLMASSRSSQSTSSVRPARLNACVAWSDEQICNIESGEVIGQTDLSNEEITRDYIELRRDWAYMPIFWNCHDLAIRLAYIIVQPSMDVITSLKSLMMSLHRAYHREFNWISATMKVTLGGWGACFVGGLASAPTLAIVGAGVFMVGWCGCFFGGFVKDSKERARHKFMINLEKKFPQLVSLHR